MSMKIGDFVRTWNMTKITAAFLSKAYFFSMGLNIILAWGLVFQDETIIQEPPMSTQQKVIFKENWASESYHKSWGMYLAGTFGNVTPKTVDFVKDIVGAITDPSIYNDVILQVQRQAEEIKRERVSKSFAISDVIFENETGKVFIEGQADTKGYYDAGEPVFATYEFRFKIKNYQPRLVALDYYEGEALTIENLRRLKSKDKKSKDKKSKERS